MIISFLTFVRTFFAKEEKGGGGGVTRERGTKEAGVSLTHHLLAFSHFLCLPPTPPTSPSTMQAVTRALGLFDTDGNQASLR